MQFNASTLRLVGDGHGRGRVWSLTAHCSPWLLLGVWDGEPNGKFWAARLEHPPPFSPRNDRPLDPGSESNLPGDATQSFQIDVLQMGEHGTEDKTVVAERWALGWGLEIQRASNAHVSPATTEYRRGRFVSTVQRRNCTTRRPELNSDPSWRHRPELIGADWRRRGPDSSSCALICEIIEWRGLMSELADGHSCPVGSSTQQAGGCIQPPFSALPRRHHLLSSRRLSIVCFVVLTCLLHLRHPPVPAPLPHPPRASSTLPKHAQLQPTALARHLVQRASRALLLLPPQGRLRCSTT